ncbi:MAG: elongation factor P hydroxylase [Hydrogenovibrio sp.]
MPHHSIDDLIRLFDNRFLNTHNTCLVCCEEEPIYRPADHAFPHHRIIFAHGFFASALHEIAHWCIAGKERRLQEDFGYWYEPDGRSVERQAAFEKVEIKPQALEWIFSVCADFPFVFSADNLSGGVGVSAAFQENVHQQVLTYLEKGLPKDAQAWAKTLLNQYRPQTTLGTLSPCAFEMRRD